MKKELEKDIQLSVCEYLTLKKHFFWRANNIPVFDKKAGFYRPMPKYAMQGVPDIIIIGDGGFVIFLEIKSSVGKLSKSQKEFQRRCKEVGAEYYVIKTVDQLIDLGL